MNVLISLIRELEESIYNCLKKKKKKNRKIWLCTHENPEYPGQWTPTKKMQKRSGAKNRQILIKITAISQH